MLANGEYTALAEPVLHHPHRPVNQSDEWPRPYNSPTCLSLFNSLEGRSGGSRKWLAAV